MELLEAIGIFDSGVGGLSIWKEINRKMPWENTIYLADQKHFPYGEKSSKQIQKRAEVITELLINRGCTSIVIACNSATVCAIEKLRNKFNIHFVGVEPAIKPAARLSRTREITVLATSKTLKSKRQKSLISSYAGDIKVNIYAAPKFVKLVEEGKIDTKETKQRIQDFFANHNLGKSDILVLACTHYPFLKKIIASVCGIKIKILDPSEPVARQVLKMRKQTNLNKNQQGRNIFYTTKDPSKFSKVSSQLLMRKLTGRKADI